MNRSKLAVISRIIFITIFSALILYVGYLKLAPYGASIKLTSNSTSDPIKITPANRITLLNTNDSTSIKVLSDLIYFETKMKYSYDIGKVKLTYKNSSENQNIEIGFRDQETWHYLTQSIDTPFMNELKNNGWITTNEKPYIFQKNLSYHSIDQILTSPPENGRIGTFNYDQNIFRNTYTPNYTPSQQDTIINIPLRDTFTFYTYVNNEMFKLTVWKQDLNWYEDPDVVTIKIYKEEDIVYSAQIDDDGIIDASRKNSQPQQVDIQNPGPGLPEPGIYKVVIETEGDSVITKLQTNLHKIVFDSPIYPIENNEVYPELFSQTKPTTVLTDAVEVTALTQHQPSEQEIKIGTVSAQLATKQEFSIPLTEPVTEITLPESNVVLRGKQGYFFFNKDHYFQPNRFRIQNITNKKDLEDVDYIITNYNPPKQEGEWKVSETEFDLRTAHVQDGKLSWIIRAPGLKENGNEVIIKSIEVELIKKPLINR